MTLDNVSTVLRSDFLCQLLTQSETQIRILGKSESVKVPSTSLIACTGNNVSLHGDLNRRAIRIRLDPKCERPDEMAFPFDPVEMAKKRRAELVASALTILRAYIVAGAPGRASAMGSFEDWSDLVRSSLIWLNYGDCRGAVDEMRSADPEKVAVAEIMDALPETPFTAKQIRVRVSEDADVRAALAAFIDRTGTFSTTRFAGFLRRWKDSVIGGRYIQLVSADAKHGSTWCVFGQQE